MAKRSREQREAAAVAVRRDVGGRPSLRPTEAQRKYLALGLGQPGGKLPLFDRNGAAIDRKTVESCLSRGWAEPWFANPTKPDWLVCKLTAAGYAVLGEAAAGAAEPP